MILWEVFTGLNPFAAVALFKEGLDTISDAGLGELIEKCTLPDPDHRPSFENIIHHLLCMLKESKKIDKID